MARAAWTRQLGEMFTREEKRQIPLFSGQTELAYDWLKSAERVAYNNDWDDSQRLKFFSDRFRDEALDWFNEYMENPVDNSEPPREIGKHHVTYKIWKVNFLKRFQDETGIERVRSKLNNLSQLPDQSVKTFISRINSLYNRVHGKGLSLSDTPSIRERELHAENELLRSQDKYKILVNGLTKKVRDELWHRMNPNASYEEACKLAVVAENVVVNHDLSEEKGLTAVVAVTT
jgi:hypothetical protein